MPEIRFQGKQIHAILVTSGGIGVPQGMGREAAAHAKGTSESQKSALEPLLVHRRVKTALLCKEPLCWALSGRKRVPVLQDHVPNASGKRNITVRMVLGFTDMYLHGGRTDVRTFEVT